MDPRRHVTPEEFRRYGRDVVDWIADYYERIEDYPVLSQVAPGEIRAALPKKPPETGEDFETILADVESKIVPGITHWQSPRFFAYFRSNVSGPAILGDLLASGLGVQGMLWATSPACTELETHVLDWLVDMLDLPRRFHSSTSGGGVIQERRLGVRLRVGVDEEPCLLEAALGNGEDDVGLRVGEKPRVVRDPRSLERALEQRDHSARCVP